MDIMLNFAPDFETVFLINGVFLENADKVRYADNQVLYVTVFPLKALLLPYTIKMVGGRVVTNKELCHSYALPQNNFFVRLLPRYNYVYSGGQKEQPISHNGLVGRFFSLVKADRIAEARTLMTPALNSTIDDASITDFFSEFVDLVENTIIEPLQDTYFLIDKVGQSVLFRFVLGNEMIDNIEEIPTT